jgi:hypothetical protein
MFQIRPVPYFLKACVCVCVCVNRDVKCSRQPTLQTVMLPPFSGEHPARLVQVRSIISPRSLRDTPKIAARTWHSVVEVLPVKTVPMSLSCECFKWFSQTNRLCLSRWSAVMWTQLSREEFRRVAISHLGYRIL